MAAVHQSADTIIELTQLIERGPEAPDGRMPGQAPSSPAQSASRTPAISPLVANMIPGLTEKVGGLMDKFSFLEDRILRISDRLNRVEQSGAFKTGGPDGKEMKNEIARELRDNLASRMAGFDGRMEGLLKRLGDVEQKAVSASEELSRLRFDPDDMERRIADLGRARKEAEADFANKFHALSERLAGFEGALGDRIAAAVDAKTAVFDTAGLAQRVDALAEAKDLADKGFSSTIAELAGRLERFEGGLADAMGQYLADHAPAVKPEDLAQRLDALAEAREKAQADFEGRLASLAGKLDGIEKGVEQSLSALRLDQGSLARECQEFDGRLQALAQAKDEAAAGFARRLEDLASQLSAMEAGLEGRLAEYAARASAQSADEIKKDLDSRLAALADDSASALASFQDELSVITDKVLGVENGIGLRIAQEVAGAEQNLNKTVDERLEAAIEARLGTLRTQSQESARQLSDRLAETAQRLDALNGGMQERMERFLADRLPALRDASGQAEIERLSASLAELAGTSGKTEAGFQASLAELASRVQAFEGGFEAKVAALLDQKDKDIRADLGRLAEQDAQALAQQEQRISDLASRVEGFEAGLSGRVAGIVQDNQADLAERLEELASQGREQERKTAVRLDEFMEKISDLEDGIAQQVEGVVADKATEFDDRLRQLEEGLCGQPGELESRLDSIRQDIQPRVEEAVASTASELSQRIDELQKSTDASLDSLSRKVDGVGKAAGDRMDGLLFEKTAQLTERIRKVEENAGEQTGALAVRLALLEDGVEPRIAKALGAKAETLAAHAREEADARIAPIESRLGGLEGGLDARIEDAVGKSAAQAREEADARIAPLESRLGGLEGGLDARIEDAVGKSAAQAREETDARIAPLESRLGGLEDGLDARIGDAVGKSAAQAREEAEARIAPIESRLGGLEDGLDARIGDAVGKSMAQAREEAEARIAPIESRLGGLEDGLDARIGDAVGKSMAQAREEAEARIAPLESRLGGLEDGLDARIGDAVGKTVADAEHRADALESRLSVLDDGFNARVTGIVEEQSRAVEQRLQEAGEAGRKEAMSGISAVAERVDALERGFESFGKTAQLLEASAAGKAGSEAVQAVAGGLASLTGRLDELEAGLDGRVQAGTAALEASFDAKLAEMAEGHREVRGQTRVLRAQMSSLISAKDNIMEQVDGLKTSQQELGDSQTQRLDSLEERIGQAESKAREIAEAAVLEQTDALQAKVASDFSRQDERLNSAMEDLRKNAEAAAGPLQQSVAELKAAQEDFGGQSARTAQRLDSLEERIGQAESKAREIAEAAVLEQTGALQAKVASDFARQDEKLNSAMEDLRNNAEAAAGPLQQSVAELKAAQEDFGGQGIRTAQRLDSLEERLDQAESKAREIAEAAVLEQTGALQAQISTLLSSKDSLMDQLANGFSRQDERLASAVDDLRRDIDAKVEAVKSAQENLGGQGLRTAQRLDSLEERIGSAEDRVREIAQAAVLNQTGELREQIAGIAASRDSLADQLADGFSRQDEQLASAVDDLRRDIDAKVNAVQSAQEALGGELGSVQSALDRLGSPEALAESSAKAAVEPLRQSIDDLKAAQQELNGQGAGQNQRLESLERRLDSAESAGEELATGQTALVQRLDGMADSLAAVEAKTADAGAERLADLATRLDGIEGRIDSSASQAQQLVDQAVRDQTGALSSQIRTLLSSRESLMSQISAGLSRQDVRLADAVEELRRDIDAKVGSLKGAQTALGGVLGDVRSALDQIGSPEALAQKSAEVATATLQQNLDELKAAQQQLGDSQAQRLDSLEDRLGQAEGRARELAEETVAPLRQNLDELKAAQQQLGDSQAQRLDSLEDRLGQAEGRARELAEETVAPLRQNLDELKTAQQELGGQSQGQAQRLDSLEARLGQAEGRARELAEETVAPLRQNLDELKTAQQELGGQSAGQAQRLDSLEDRLGQAEGRARELAEETVAPLRQNLDELKTAQQELGGQSQGQAQRLDSLEARLGQAEGRARELAEETVAPLRQNLDELKTAQQELGGQSQGQAQRLDSLEDRLGQAEGRARELAEETVAPLRQNLDKLKTAQQELGGQSQGQAQRLDSLEARLGRAEAAGEGIVSGQTALAKRLDGLQEEGGRSAREARERLDSMAESLAAIEDRVGSSAERRFTALASRLETTLRADIDAVKDAQEAGSSKIRTTLDEMAARLDSQSGAGQEAGLAAVEEKVALLSASRSELENELSGKLADLGARLSAFEGRMREQVEERMPAQARSVTEVASRMGALEGRIDAAVLSMERKVAQLVSMAERQADLVQEADPALMEGIERLSRAIAHLLEKEERNQEALIALRRDADQALQRTTPKAVEQTAAEICAKILREEIAALVADMEDAG